MSVEILSSDGGAAVQVGVESLKDSVTYSNMAGSIDVETLGPIPEVTTEGIETAFYKILPAVTEARLKYEREHPETKELPKELGWEAVNAELAEDSELMGQCLLLFNFLDMNAALNACARAEAEVIKGKTAEEIRKRYNLPPPEK